MVIFFTTLKNRFLHNNSPPILTVASSPKQGVGVGRRVDGIGPKSIYYINVFSCVEPVLYKHPKSNENQCHLPKNNTSHDEMAATTQPKSHH